ncbi:MAG TPA: FAD-dependent oxidoreductase, partial [Pyrinomonadaceae bacterium]
MNNDSRSKGSISWDRRRLACPDTNRAPAESCRRDIWGPSINRRDFLRGAAAASAVLLNTRVANGLAGGLTSAFPAHRPLPPVNVSRDRVIREVVGLRPYRPTGFVVDAERFGYKLLVHNYGHGGGGVTLSWGTASLAVDLARGFVATHRARRRRFAVLGCGVSGLSTAILLQRRFQDGPGTVTIYAKDLPPDTTSNVAGAWWSPTSVYEESTPEFNDQFRRACRISNRAFQLLV